MRRLILIVLYLTIAVQHTFAQDDPSNPDKATCGLPAQGTIVASVEYTLTANCTQTRWLEIKTSETPNITLTINGGGHTITNTSYVDPIWRTTYLYNFLVVDDDGERTAQNLDIGRSPNVKVIIKNITFDGSDLPFRRPWYRQPDGHDRRSGTGVGILVDGALTMENVTFTNGNQVWVWAKGTATLKNVLFKDSEISRFGFHSNVKGVLHVAKSASVTLNNAVFRDVGRTVVVIEKGGKLTTTGCLRFIRVLSHKVHHSGVWRGFGAWSNSAKPCSNSMEIGNKGQAVVAYTLPTLPCSLPSSGIIEGTVVYTLTQPCVCVSIVSIAEGAHVTINGNGNPIEGCTTGKGFGQFRVGNAHLTINNAILHNMRIYNYGGQFTIADSTVRNVVKVPILNYGWAYLLDSRFENNKGDRDSNIYYGHGWFGLGRALFRDNVFHNNSPGDTEAYTTGGGTAIYLCGENIREGLPQEADARQLPLFLAENGGGIFGCPQDEPASPAVARIECQREKTNLPEDKHLGALGIIMYKQKCPSEVEIWEILPNSRGQLALKLNQHDIEAMREGDMICSTNGRTAVRVGLTEAVRQLIMGSNAYRPPSQRGARDILVSIGPTFEDKVHHIVLDNALDGGTLGTVDTRPDGPPCAATAQDSVTAIEVITAEPIPVVYYASAVGAQPAQADGSIVHVVQPGDTIWQIGIAYDVHPYRIITRNELSADGRSIHPGQKLLIRPAQ